MTKYTFAFVVLAMSSFSHFAAAQVSATVPADQIKTYCIWNGKLFSPGSWMCVATEVQIQCVLKDGAAEWTSNEHKNCKGNSGSTPQ